MSGNLKILVHKRWNVWNQDNQEKVLKDERLHREAIEKHAKDQQLLQQESDLEQLHNNINNISDVDAINIKNNKPEVFRLFGEIEDKINAELDNEEYRKEKEQKELLEKKKQGIDPWSLGDGSIEKSGISPWYENSKFIRDNNGDLIRLNSNDDIKIRGIIVKGNEAKKVREREIERKNNIDPMNQFLKFEDKSSCNINNSQTSLINENKRIKIEIKKNSITEDEDNNFNRDKKNKKNKKDKKEKKDKKDKSNNYKISGIDILRQKRLDREKIENRKTSLLLAENDKYGNYLVDNRPYNHQYNPEFAKNK
jgi:hypothetical protein